MKLTWVLGLLWAIPWVCFGGFDVGNGGHLLLCHNETGSELELLDFWQAEQNGLVMELGGANLSVEEKLERVISRLRKLDPDRHKRLRQGARQFLRNAIFRPSIPQTNDVGHVKIPQECELRQGAAQLAPRFPGDITFIIDKNSWGHLSKDEKAGLILHELVYQEFIAMGQSTSKLARTFVGKISSREFVHLTSNEYLRYLANIGLPIGAVTESSPLSRGGIVGDRRYLYWFQKEPLKEGLHVRTLQQLDALSGTVTQLEEVRGNYPPVLIGVSSEGKAIWHWRKHFRQVFIMATDATTTEQLYHKDCGDVPCYNYHSYPPRIQGNFAFWYNRVYQRVERLNLKTKVVKSVTGSLGWRFASLVGVSQKFIFLMVHPDVPYTLYRINRQTKQIHLVHQLYGHDGDNIQIVGDYLFIRDRVEDAPDGKFQNALFRLDPQSDCPVRMLTVRGHNFSIVGTHKRLFVGEYQNFREIRIEEPSKLYSYGEFRMGYVRNLVEIGNQIYIGFKGGLGRIQIERVHSLLSPEVL